MATNPFYVQPASPLGGVTEVVDAVKNRVEVNKKNAVREQMREAVQSGNTDDLANIAIKNPWITDELDKFYKFRNEATKQNAIETARNIVLGGSPSQHLIDRADFVIGQGGDPAETIQLAEMAQEDPEKARKEAERVLAVLAPQEYMALKKFQEVEKPKTQIVDGQLVTIAPDGTAVAAPIEGLSVKPKEPASDYERWKANPAEYARFKAASRVGEGGGTSEKAPSGYRRLPNGDLTFIPGGPADPKNKAAKEQPTKALPASQVESLIDMQRVANALSEATDIASKKGVKTGPISGRLQSLQATLGTASDEFLDVDQRLQTASNIMLKLRSGAAVTESEYQRFVREYPQITDKKSVRERKAKNTIRYMNELINDKVEAFKESGYKTPNLSPVMVPGEEQPAAMLPPEAARQLQPGKITAFKNGQRWTIGPDGQPQRVQ